MKNEDPTRAAVDARCPRCESPAPHLHPALQHEGEVELCRHSYHLQETPENTPAKIAETRRMLAIFDGDPHE